MNILFMETSAKAGHNVKSLFKKIAMSLPGMDKEGQTADANQSMDVSQSICCRVLIHERRDRRNNDADGCSRGIFMSMLTHVRMFGNLGFLSFFAYSSLRCIQLVCFISTSQYFSLDS